MNQPPAHEHSHGLPQDSQDMMYIYLQMTLVKCPYVCVFSSEDASLNRHQAMGAQILLSTLDLRSSGLCGALLSHLWI